jgi:hypothetical protein
LIECQDKPRDVDDDAGRGYPVGASPPGCAHSVTKSLRGRRTRRPGLKVRDHLFAKEADGVEQFLVLCRPDCASRMTSSIDMAAGSADTALNARARLWLDPTG